MCAVRFCLRVAICFCLLVGVLVASADSGISVEGTPFAPPWTTVEPPAPTWGNVQGFVPATTDSRGREGRWWWPEQNDREGQDASQSGNGGRVFGPWKEPEPPTITVFDPPLPDESTPPQGIPNPLVVDPNRLIVIENVYFSLGSFQLNQAGKREVRKQADRMLRFKDDTVACVGHADDTGSDEENMIIGELRAQAVKNYLVECGVEANRVSVASKGESEPVAPNDTPENRARNRRVAFDITLGN